MEEDERNMEYERYKMGSNLDAPTLSVMFQHLEDVSTLPIPHMLNKIYKRTRVYQAPIDTHKGDIEESRTKVTSWRDSWIGLKENEENCIEQDIGRAKFSSEYEENEQEQAATTEVRRPPRTTSLVTTAPIVPSPSERRCYSKAASPVTVVKVQKWLPEAMMATRTQSQTARSNTSYTPPESPTSEASRSNDSRNTVASPSSKFSRSNASYKVHSATTPSTKSSRSVPHPTPSAATKTQSITASPSSRRLPFHGNDEYLLPPPCVPPKSQEQLVQAASEKQIRDRQLQFENERLKRENSQLQNALHQVLNHEQRMKSESSGLRETLQQIQISPGGLMRRLSKAGSRARGRSPFKSSRTSLTKPNADMSAFDMGGQGRASME
jgi:hypothetical protein